MTNLDPEKYLSSMEEQLLAQPKIRFEEIKNGTVTIPNAPGVYLIHDKEGICYVGETGNLMGRMKDILRTVNHSFRRTIGAFLYSSNNGYIKATSKNKFPAHIEVKLDQWMMSNLSISWMKVPLGRKELEERICGLEKVIIKYNSKGRRRK